MARQKEVGLTVRGKQGIIWISYIDPVNGKRIRVSSGTTLKEKAKRLRAQLMSEAYDRKQFGEPVSLSCAEIIEWAWKNHWSRRPDADYSQLTQRLKNSFLHFGMVKASLLRVETIQEYITTRLIECENATVNREMGDWRSAFNLAIKSDGMLEKNPFASIPILEEKRRDRIATPQERVDLIDGWKNWSKHTYIEPSVLLRDIIEFDFYSGLRAGEIRKLKWTEVNFDAMEMRVESRKGRKGKLHVRYVPIFPEAMAVLQRRPRGSEFVFPGKNGAMMPKAGMISNFARMTERMEIPNFHFHDIRHTFATEYYRRTKNIAAISYILGHVSIETTMIYLNLKREDLMPHGGFSLYPASPVSSAAERPLDTGEAVGSIPTPGIDLVSCPSGQGESLQNSYSLVRSQPTPIRHNSGTSENVPVENQTKEVENQELLEEAVG